VSARVRRRVVAVTAGVLVIGLVAWAAVVAARWLGRLRTPTSTAAVCDLAGSQYTVTPEQAGNAATVTAVALNRGLPERAVVIALATAMQESKLVNVEYGDRDSLGLFQQRPSQGWGTAQQILNPAYAAGKFYDAMVAVPGWQRLPVAEVAQRVQQSAFPDAYTRWEPPAGALAHVLAARVPAGMSCRFDPDAVAAQRPDSTGLVPRARAVLAAAGAELGSRRVAASGPADQARREGRALDLAPAGWFTANWLVAHAQALAIRQVGFDGRLWTPEHGWQPAGAGQSGQGLKDRISVQVG
jgi:hypothetical protein